jgi:uncharacterized protein (DUF608 family)
MLNVFFICINIHPFQKCLKDYIQSRTMHNYVTLRSEIHKLINCIWNKEELPEQWKESIIVPIYNKVDKTDWRNYRGISLLSTS